MLLIRGVLKGKPATTLAQELELHYSTVLELRHDLQDKACFLQPSTLLPDEWTETDEMFQNAGEKEDEHFDPTDPPRRRANKRPGRGPYTNDRPRL